MKRAVNTAEAAKITGISYDTLTYWRFQGKGPRFLKMGGLVRYRLEDLEAFMLSRTMNTREAAEFTGICENTLKHWRIHGKGPRCIKFGGLVRYRPEDLEAFMESCLVDPADPKEKP
jgi:predicted site-specific integrase-resolvase